MMADDVSVKVDVMATVRTLSLTLDNAEKAAFYALAQVALAVERQAKINAVQGGTHARGTKTPATPGSGPARITGALQRSIHTEVRREGLGDYSATVLPGMVYARQVELGGGRWTTGVNYPYMIPAGRKVKPRAEEIFMKAFSRKWRR
jgi:hypothetical protein